MKRLSLIVLALCICILNGCSFNSTRLNNEADKAEAQKIVNQFYDHIKANEPKACLDLFGSKFYAVTSKEKLLEILAACQRKLGPLENTAIPTVNRV